MVSPALPQPAPPFDLRAARAFLQGWFAPAAADVAPEADGISPVVSVSCFHRTVKVGGQQWHRAFTRPVGEAVSLVDDLQAADVFDGQWNVYVRATTMVEGPARGRGGAGLTCQLPGVWADLDAKDGWDAQTVQRFVDRVPLPPPLVVWSGGGWHCWWQVDAPFYGVSEVGQVLRRWRATVERVATEVGLRADSACSGDMARVMRLPGTPNVKAERPGPVPTAFVGWAEGTVSSEDLTDVLDPAPVAARPIEAGAGVTVDRGRPGDAFSIAVPMLSLLEAMGGHSWVVDTSTEGAGDVHVMRPGKQRGSPGATIYGDDGHVAFWSSSWVGPGTDYPNVALALSGAPGCVYSSGFRLLAHSRFVGPGEGVEEGAPCYRRAREHVQSLGYGADWDPRHLSDEDWARLVGQLGHASSAVVPMHTMARDTAQAAHPSQPQPSPATSPPSEPAAAIIPGSPEWLARWGDGAMAHAALQTAATLEAAASTDWRARLVDGADWLSRGTPAPEPIWGAGEELLAVRRQPTVIAGPQGSGKTVLAGRLILGALGVAGFEALLGHPVAPTPARVLYLAADRPDQARLSMLRMLAAVEAVRGRLVVWPGPPPWDVAKAPQLLVDMAIYAGASLVVVDSLKDVALKLTDDEVGSAVNRAIQLCVAADVDVVSLHHPRKLGGEDSDARPRKLDDLYGSTWLTSGAGSVLYLHRPSTENVVELGQLKTPVGREVSLTFRHDMERGTVELAVGFEVVALDLVRDAGPAGISAAHLARCYHLREDVTATERKRAFRALQRMFERGQVELVAGTSKDGAKYRVCAL